MPRRERDVTWLVTELDKERRRFLNGDVEILPREEAKLRDMLNLRTGDFTHLKETARIRRRKAGQRLNDLKRLGTDLFFLSTQVLTVSTLCDLEKHFVDRVAVWWKGTEHPVRLWNIAQELLAKHDSSSVSRADDSRNTVDVTTGKTGE